MAGLFFTKHIFSRCLGWEFQAPENLVKMACFEQSLKFGELQKFEALQIIRTKFVIEQRNNRLEPYNKGL